MGKKRSFAAYLKMVGIDPLLKKTEPNQWCHQGDYPPNALQYKIDKPHAKGLF